MGLSLKKKNNHYQIWCSISSQKIHDKEWLTEDEAKAVIIERKFHKFMDEIIETDMEFPRDYYINDRHVVAKDKPSFYKWRYCSDISDADYVAKLREITKRLDIDTSLLSL